MRKKNANRATKARDPSTIKLERAIGTRLKKVKNLMVRAISEIDAIIGDDDVSDEAWAAVAAADAAFGHAGATWVETGSEDDLGALRASYESLLAAWRDVDYDEQGDGEPTEYEIENTCLGPVDMGDYDVPCMQQKPCPKHP